MTGTSTPKGGLYLAFLASTHFVIHVYTMLLPVLLLPLQEELGVSLVQISLLASIPRLLNVFIYLPTGAISDRYPSQMLTLSFVVTAAGAILVPLSRSFPLLILGFTLISVGSTLYHPPSLKMASEYDPNRMSLSMGIHNVGSSLGFAAGPLLLGYMMVNSDWRNSYYVWATLTVTTAALSYRYARRHLRGSGEDSSLGQSTVKGLRSLMTRGFLMVVAVSTLVETVFNILVTYIPAYFTIQLGMTYSLSSTITGLGPLTGLAGSFLGGYSGVRFGNYRMGVAVLASIAVLLMAFPNLTALWLVIAVYGLSRCLQATFMPLMNSMIADNSDANSRSLGYSFNFVVVSLMASISITVTSMLIESYGTTVIFPISIAAIIPSAILIILLRRQSRR
jgi:FSR family fosmidomycin resistance protein-like MFS transporter